MFSSTVGLEPTRDKPNCLVGSRNSHYAMRTFYSDITPFILIQLLSESFTYLLLYLFF